MEKRPYIFGSHALLKFFQKEKGYEKVVHLLQEIRKTGVTKYINAIHLGEIIYSTKKEFGDQKKLEVLANIERLNFTILPIPNHLIFQAADKVFSFIGFQTYEETAVLP
ncbi:MAG: type II toxin-antitoxin system VapC family toxin [Deltaproteobacteria bacterium]|nr:type II toxin-antitoxin system VapC family toxin [Deltaproteobacteria bacterium]